MYIIILAYLSPFYLPAHNIYVYIIYNHIYMIILPYFSIIYLLTIYLSIYHLRLCFYSGSLIDVLRVISDQTEANSKEIGLQDLTISLTYAKISM
jgi:hypothetical protein